MNSPSNRHHSWLWLPVEFTCVGLLFVGIAASFVTAQENPTASPPSAPVQSAVSPRAAAPEFLPRLSPNEQKILDALNDNTEVAFNDNPLQEALNYLKDLHGIEIWMDRAALSSEGVATDKQVNLILSGITLQSTLRLLLEPMSLTHVIEDEVLKITTQDAASKRLVTRTYPVGDLFESREEANELVEVIVSGLGLDPKGKKAAPPDLLVPRTASIKTLTIGVVTPAAAQNKSTQAKKIETIAVSIKARAIVARQTHAVHDQIQQLLRDLREAKSFAPAQPLAEWSGPGGQFYAPPNTDTPSKPTTLDEFSPSFRPDDSQPRRALPDPNQDELAPPAKLPAPAKPGTAR